jgi:hypothetical protein
VIAAITAVPLASSAPCGGALRGKKRAATSAAAPATPTKMKVRRVSFIVVSRTR